MSPTKELPHPDEVALGARIRLLRKRAGLSQESMARTIGVSFQQVQQYERGTNRVSYSRLTEIAQCLDMSTVELIAPLDRNRDQALGGIDYMTMLQEPHAMDALVAFSRLATAKMRKAALVLLTIMAGSTS